MRTMSSGRAHNVSYTGIKTIRAFSLVDNLEVGMIISINFFLNKKFRYYNKINRYIKNGG